MRRFAGLGLALALGVCATGDAQATLLGGQVPNKSFGGATVYNYQGSSVSAFTVAGSGTFQVAFATYRDAFGISQTDQSNQVVIFDTNFDRAGATASIAPGYSPFLLFFKTFGTDQSASCNPSTGADCVATLFSDGTTQGVAGGNDGGQANLAIYYAASTSTYAMFFDDGGGYSIDDNSYYDLVVTFTPTTTPNVVPEPASLALLGFSLAGLCLIKLRKMN